MGPGKQPWQRALAKRRAVRGKEAGRLRGEVNCDSVFACQYRSPKGAEDAASNSKFSLVPDLSGDPLMASNEWSGIPLI